MVLVLGNVCFLAAGREFVLVLDLTAPFCIPNLCVSRLLHVVSHMPFLAVALAVTYRTLDFWHVRRLG
jgi:hypothetical protein